MKRLLIVFIIALTHSITAYCQHPYKQDLGGIATITFPDTPKTKTISGITVHFLNYNNSLYLCQASELDNGLGELLNSNHSDSAYSSFINAALKSSKGHLYYKNDLSIGALDGIEFGFTSKAKGKIYYNYTNVFILNNVLINYSYLSSDSLKKDDKKIRAFFNTFKLTINESGIRQDSASELGHKTGELIGILFIIGIVVLLGFGIVYIIKKITYK